MTADDFIQFLQAMGWNKSVAAKRLAISRNTVDRYIEGGAPASIGLACAALAAGMSEWVPSDASVVLPSQKTVTAEDLRELQTRLSELIDRAS